MRGYYKCNNTQFGIPWQAAGPYHSWAVWQAAKLLENIGLMPSAKDQDARRKFEARLMLPDPPRNYRDDGVEGIAAFLASTREKREHFCHNTVVPHVLEKAPKPTAEFVHELHQTGGCAWNIKNDRSKR